MFHFLPKEMLLNNAIVILDEPLSSELFPFTVTFISDFIFTVQEVFIQE